MHPPRITALTFDDDPLPCSFISVAWENSDIPATTDCVVQIRPDTTSTWTTFVRRGVSQLRVSPAELVHAPEPREPVRYEARVRLGPSEQSPRWSGVSTLAVQGPTAAITVTRLRATQEGSRIAIDAAWMPSALDSGREYAVALYPGHARAAATQVPVHAINLSATVDVGANSPAQAVGVAVRRNRPGAPWSRTTWVQLHADSDTSETSPAQHTDAEVWDSSSREVRGTRPRPERALRITHASLGGHATSAGSNLSAQWTFVNSFAARDVVRDFSLALRAIGASDEVPWSVYEHRGEMAAEIPLTQFSPIPDQRSGVHLELRVRASSGGDWSVPVRITPTRNSGSTGSTVSIQELRLRWHLGKLGITVDWLYLPGSLQASLTQFKVAFRWRSFSPSSRESGRSRSR